MFNFYIYDLDRIDVPSKYGFVFNGLRDDPIFQEAIDWCRENFGLTYTLAGYSIFIKDEAKAFLFRLRWC